MMSVFSIPSRLKGLALTISQVILVFGVSEISVAADVGIVGADATISIGAGEPAPGVGVTDIITVEVSDTSGGTVIFAGGADDRTDAGFELISIDVEDLVGIASLRVGASDALLAELDALSLGSSGLFNVERLGCSEFETCVSIRALSLTELAAAKGVSPNRLAAASAAQSALLVSVGTTTGDAFLELVRKVQSDNLWEQLDPSGQGESLLASRGSERVVSRYIQGLMQQGRSSGEEFSAAGGLWMQALQSRGDGDAQDLVAGYEVDTAGFALGYDTEFASGISVGGALSYGDTEVESDDDSSQVTSDSYMLSAYTQWTQGAWFSNALLTYGQSDNDSRRVIAGSVAQADYDSDFMSLRAQGGKAFGFESGWLLRPRAEFNYSYINVDDYDEQGSVAALSVDAQRYEVIELGLGAELSKMYIVNKAVFTPSLDVAVYHDLAGDNVQTTNRFVIGGDSFVTTGNDVEQTNVSATLGLQYAAGASHVVKIAYEYFGNSDYQTHSGLLRYSYSF